MSHYRIGRNWDATFSKVADTLMLHPEIDPREYVEFQIRWLISKGDIGIFYPNILSGEKAIGRFFTGRKTETMRLDDESQYILAQIEVFNRTARNLGDAYALKEPIGDASPVIRVFMYILAGKQAPQDLIELAKGEWRDRPLMRKFLPVTVAEVLDD